MNKILLALFVCVFTTGAFACGGNGNKEKEKEKEKDQRIAVSRLAY